MVARLRGDLSVQALEAALACVQQNHPLLRVRIETTPKGAVFEQHEVPTIPLQVVDAPATTLEEVNKQITYWIEQEISVAIPAHPGPLVRCVWVRHGGDLQHLLMTFHHAIGDGTSGAILFRELFQALAAPVATSSSQLDATPVVLPKPMEERLPKQVRGFRELSCIIKTVRHYRQFDRLYGLPTPLPLDKDALVDGPKSSIFLNEFDREITRELVEQSRANGTTVNGALSAALCLELAPMIGDGKHVSIKHRSAVNLRNDLHPAVGDEIGLFVAMLFNRMSLTGSEEFWEVAREIKTQQKASLGIHAQFGMTSVVSWLYKAIRGDKLSNDQLVAYLDKTRPCNTGLSNLGRVDLPTEGGGLTVEAFYFAIALATLAEVNSTALTFDGRLFWNFICPQRVFAKERAERLVANTVARLHSVLNAKSFA